MGTPWKKKYVIKPKTFSGQVWRKFHFYLLMTLFEQKKADDQHRTNEINSFCTK